MILNLVFVIFSLSNLATGDINFSSDFHIIKKTDVVYILQYYYEIPQLKLFFVKSDSGFYGQYQVNLQILDRKELIAGKVLKREIFSYKYEDTGLLNTTYLDSIFVDFPSQLTNQKITAKVNIYDLNSDNYGETQAKLYPPGILGSIQFYKNDVLNPTHTYTSEQNKSDTLNLNFEINSLSVRSCSLLIKKESDFTNIVSSKGSNKTKAIILREFFPVENENLAESTAWLPIMLHFSYSLSNLSSSGQYKAIALAYDKTGEKIDETEDVFTVQSSFLYSDVDYFEMVNRLLYIATESEMKKLRNAPIKERESLWSDFWKGRDPTPTSQINETEDEYFSRIHYCIKNFSKGDNGYKSNRAKIYMKYGPPDFIESQPFERFSYANEIWNYYRIGKQYVFIDSHGFGQFILLEENKL